MSLTVDVILLYEQSGQSVAKETVVLLRRAGGTPGLKRRLRFCWRLIKMNQLPQPYER